jgi:hypothetical protein
MNKKRFFLIATLAAVLTCGMTLTASRIRFHRTPASAMPDLKLAQSSSAALHGRPTEGIKVHGHWIIDIRNPDGNLVAHHEFENALVPSPALASLLGRTKTAGRWMINVEEVGGVHPCLRPGGGGYEPCTIQESPVGANNINIWNTLKVTAPVSGDNANKLVLNGSATASVDTYINRVTTLLRLCESDTSPSACGAVDGVAATMTQAYLTPPVNGTCPPNEVCILHVLPDQIMQVKVVLSFS